MIDLDKMLTWRDRSLSLMTQALATKNLIKQLLTDNPDEMMSIRRVRNHWWSAAGAAGATKSNRPDCPLQIVLLACPSTPALVQYYWGKQWKCTLNFMLIIQSHSHHELKMRWGRICCCGVDLSADWVGNPDSIPDGRVSWLKLANCMRDQSGHPCSLLSWFLWLCIKLSEGRVCLCSRCLIL